MMGLYFREDGRDGGIEFDHGRVDFFASGLGCGDFIIGRFLPRLVGSLHGFHIFLFLRRESRIGSEDRIVILHHFRFFGVRQAGQHVVMMAAAGRGTALSAVGRRRGVILSFENGGRRDERAHGEDKKYSFHVIVNDSTTKTPVSQFMQFYRGSTFYEPSHKHC